MPIPIAQLFTTVQPRTAYNTYDEGVQQRHVLNTPMQVYAMAPGMNLAPMYPSCLSELFEWRHGSVYLREQQTRFWKHLGIAMHGVQIREQRDDVYRRYPELPYEIASTTTELSFELNATGDFFSFCTENRDIFKWLLLLYYRPNNPLAGLLLTKTAYWAQGQVTVGVGAQIVHEASLQIHLDPILHDVITDQELYGYWLTNWAYEPVIP